MENKETTQNGMTEEEKEKKNWSSVKIVSVKRVF